MKLWIETDDGLFEEVVDEVEELNLADVRIRDSLIRDIRNTIEYMQEEDNDDTE